MCPKSIFRNSDKTLSVVLITYPPLVTSIPKTRTIFDVIVNQHGRKILDIDQPKRSYLSQY